MAEIKTTGIVLWRRDTGEADRVLRILTRDLGMVSGIAKGVKKTKSRQAGALELFVPADMHLHRRTGELFLISRAHPAGHSQQLQAMSLAQLKVAYIMAEWLVALLPPEHSLPEVYQLCIDVLQLLRQTDRLLQLEIAFQVRLLHQLGFLPAAFRDITTQKIIRFFLSNDLSDALRLTTDEEVFQKTADTLQDVYRHTVDREGQVRGVTRDW